MRSPQERGRREERVLAKKIKGKIRPASGSLSFKGDIRKGMFLIESKIISSGLSLLFRWLEKVTREADEVGLIPILHIRYREQVVWVVNEADVEIDWGEE